MNAVAPILIGLAGDVGAPLIKRILERHIGSEGAGLVKAILGRIAGRAEVEPDELPTLAEADPQRVQKAIEATEPEAGELIALYNAGLEGQFALIAAEQKEPWWAWAWRPGAMWGFGFLWIWGLVVLPIFNAFSPLMIEAIDLGLLFNLNAIYMGLYMGGHTVKAAVERAAIHWGKR